MVDWLRPLWRGPRRRAPGLDSLLDPGFVAIDLETTGLDTRTDAVVAAAAIPVVGGRPTAGYVSLVNPGCPIPPASTAIHGITDAMVRSAPDIGEVLEHIDRTCDSHPIVGHGVAFDLAILGRARQALRRPLPPNPVFCTMRLAAALHPHWSDVTLDVVADRFQIDLGGRHTAQGDAQIAARVLLALLPAARAKGVRTLGDLEWLQATVV